MLGGFIVLSCAVTLLGGPQHTEAAPPDEPAQKTMNEYQNAPCGNQLKSFAELRRAFNAARIPSRSEMNGAWVAVGIFGDARSHGHEIIALNCGGLTRDEKYEQVILAESYSVELHFVGTDTMRRDMTPDKRGSINFPVDFGGDESPSYRCRLTSKKTLVCLIDVYREGFEFKKMTVTRDKLYEQH